jgi:hypothetical protein
MSHKINERGQALIMVLFCSVVAFLFVMAVLFMINRGQQSSGMEKRYETSLDAADGGVSVSVQLLDNKKISISGGAFSSNVAYNPLPGSCLYQKLNMPTPLWGACSAAQKNVDDMSAAASDMTFTVNGATDSTGKTPTFDVFAKIIDSRKGVTAAAPGNLQTGGVVNSEGALTPVELPYFYYTVQVVGRAQMGKEQANLTYIYAD